MWKAGCFISDGCFISEGMVLLSDSPNTAASSTCYHPTLGRHFRAGLLLPCSSTTIFQSPARSKAKKERRDTESRMWLRAKGRKSRGYCTHSTALPRKQCPNTAGEGATARRHGVNSGSGLRAAGAPWRGRAGSEAPAAGGAGAAAREPTTAARKWGDPFRPPPPPPALAPFALSSDRKSVV